MAYEDRIMRMAAQQGREQSIKRRDAVDRGINPRGDRVDIRFGPSEKQFTKRHYTPSGLGTTWGETGEMRRKIPGYHVGARPPRGLASLFSKQGLIGQDPRSSTYQDDWWGSTFGSPDDLRGYRASVANVAAMNAEEKQQRIAREEAGEFLPEPTIPYKHKGRFETPGEIGAGYGMMGEESLVGWPYFGKRESSYDESLYPYRGASIGDMSIGERESPRPMNSLDFYDKWWVAPPPAPEAIPMLRGRSRPVSIGERESGDVDWGGLPPPYGGLYPTGYDGRTGSYVYGSRGGIASLRR